MVDLVHNCIVVRGQRSVSEVSIRGQRSVSEVRGHLPLGALHAARGLELLLRRLRLVLPHAFDVVLVPDVPALLREDVHGGNSTPQAAS